MFDASALVDWFRGNPVLAELADQAEQGWFQLVAPATAIADAESELRAGQLAWNATFYTPACR